MNEEMNWIEEARRQWGKVFSDLSLACGYVNSAWYHTEDKFALKEEDLRRLCALKKQVQKVIDSWEINGRP